jgi:hypothetical protein
MSGFAIATELFATQEHTPAPETGKLRPAKLQLSYLIYIPINYLLQAKSEMKVRWILLRLARVKRRIEPKPAEGYALYLQRAGVEDFSCVGQGCPPEDRF